MDLELVTEGPVMEENSFGAEDIDLDYPTLEGERCGICMDIIVDRGVLDCCQHWFCFACIDNWASITNLCPLCQNEFQLITCVPVYDTVGSSLDEDSCSRDDDWCVEGKNNTLSFPSYYIDENSVVCLEGDDCKIRSGTANIAEDSNLDTSIACDSCDIWYHAFCVGFDPDESCENSWLCPRCLVASTPKRSNDHDPNNSSENLLQSTFSSKVYVSVADTGDTAVVVSLIDRNQQTEVPREKLFSFLEVSKDLKSADGGNQGNEEPSREILPDLEVKEPEVDALASISGASKCNMETTLSEKISVKPSMVAGDRELSLSHSLSAENLKSESLEHGFGQQLGLSMPSFPGVNINHENSLKECALPAEKTVQDTECAVGFKCTKRKQRDYRSTEDEESKARKQQLNFSGKKVKAKRSRPVIHVEHQMNDSFSDDPQTSTSLVAGSDVDTLRCTSRKNNATADIRDIVQGPTRRTLRRLTHTNHSCKSSKEGEIAAGLRVKKIMRRSTEDKESSMVVQNLRKEIRDAIRNKSSKDFGDNLFDPKLLAAFRAVVAGTTTTENRRPPPLDLKARKLLLQKGKVRENLTKKIYGISGRRKRAWTRDCEIEFWKHRCLKVSKPEKIETLKSVLNLLRKSPEITEIKQENDTGPSSSILSRLYLADASVFPRKDDIKPLSVIKANGILEQSKIPTSSKASAPTLGASSVSGDNEGAKCSPPSIKGKSTSSKVHAGIDPPRSSKSTSGGSPLNSQAVTAGKADLKKIDKRKWALEVLARKASVLGNNTGQEGGDNAVFKGNFPLLAQLPADMRPVLAPSRRNKIPVSIRQSQLHRLTEHFLRKTTLPVTRRTAEIELAVVDAINVEKEVADKSSTKQIYINLCSQALLHKSDNIISATSADSNSNSTSACPNDRTEVAINIYSSSEVDAALRNAGLLSDSPPSSPYGQMEDAKEIDPRENIKEEGPDNVFEIDAQPELDIYGDFEYDLEEEDFIGATALKTSKVELEESKIKVVFSTLDSNKANGAWNFEDQPATVEPRNADNLTDECPQNSSHDDGGEEPLLEECEELYGPDKEPLISKFPESFSLKPFELLSINIFPEGNGEQRLNIADKASEVLKEGCSDNSVAENVVHSAVGGEDASNQTQMNERKEKKSLEDLKSKSDRFNSVFKKVELYIKEHIRPLCKSGVITVEQYRWAVGKTTEKIMKYHSKDTNANFLIKEGEKVKKLAEQYVETAQKVEKKVSG